MNLSGSWTFNSDVENWQVAWSDPATIKTGTTLTYDAAVGSPSNGSIKLDIPFTGASQKIEVTVDPASAIDMTNRTLVARVRLDSGLSSDPTHPGGVKLFVKSGDSYVYADGGWNNLTPGIWMLISLNASTPQGYVDTNGTYAPADIREVGIEIDTGGAGGTYQAATLHLDTVGYY